MQKKISVVQIKPGFNLRLYHYLVICGNKKAMRFLLSMCTKKRIAKLLRKAIILDNSVIAKFIAPFCNGIQVAAYYELHVMDLLHKKGYLSQKTYAPHYDKYYYDFANMRTYNQIIDHDNFAIHYSDSDENNKKKRVQIAAK